MGDVQSSGITTIEPRDLPQEEPRDTELKEIAADLWGQLKKERGVYGCSDLADQLAEARIRMVLIEVRHAATTSATIKAYNRAVELLS